MPRKCNCGKVATGTVTVEKIKKFGRREQRYMQTRYVCDVCARKMNARRVSVGGVKRG